MLAGCGNFPVSGNGNQVDDGNKNDRCDVIAMAGMARTVRIITMMIGE